ncbi:hypothetical protein NQZ68_023035 [Dissostichus eleginoides]|nr:hypothetical protein NQZ68_023035 [Dissostichus eleginoides]
MQLQLTQQQPRQHPAVTPASALCVPVSFSWENGGAGMRMQPYNQLVPISIPLLGNGKTGSCGQTHEEDKCCDWSGRLESSERSQITSDYGDS